MILDCCMLKGSAHAGCSNVLCGSRAAKQRPCSRRLTAQAAVPAAATRCWAAWRSCSSCAFAMRSMAQPRHSRAERILAAIHVRNQPQRRPFSRSDTHPQPRRPAAARASISWRSASAEHREQSSSQSREIVTLRNYLGNGEADERESGTPTGLILAMPSTCDIRGVWAESS